MNENEISSHIVDSALTIHRALGPGLFEVVYEATMAHELQLRGLKVTRQAPLPVEYKGLTFEEAYRVDLFVDDKVIIELKSVERLSPVHKKQLLTYIRLKKVRLGMLINFGAEFLREGIQRVVNDLPE